MTSYEGPNAGGQPRWQFQIDGRGFGSPVRTEWALAAADAVAAGHAIWVGPNEIKMDGQGEIARL